MPGNGRFENRPPIAFCATRPPVSCPSLLPSGQVFMQSQVLSTLIGLVLAATLPANAQSSAKSPEIRVSSPTDRVQLLLGTRVVDPDSRRTYDVDLTRQAKITIENPAVARADDSGGILGLADGQTRVTLWAGDSQQSYNLVVSGVTKPAEPTFETDIQPILTRLGCNSGPCHGKQRGQNGFQLSLFGFDPGFDYHSVATEDRGRRVFPAVPETSLLLQKGTARLPHG
ncbi:MAG: hypothetical protein ACKO85_18960, partial [Isosphaeraceae bacterium]